MFFKPFAPSKMYIKYQVCNFVNTCLIKDEQQRPKYTQLLKQTFIKKSESEHVDVAAYVNGVLDKYDSYNDVDMIMMEEASNHS